MLSMGMKITHPSHLSNQELTTALRRLAQDEREATVALIVHLAEFDARRLYEPAGYSSLFKYCRAILRLSEDAVYNRIHSARAARRFPVIVDMLLARTLSPTTARLLARRLTTENHQELLSAASGLGKEDVEKLLAARFPEPDVKPSVRKVRTTPAVAVPPMGAATPMGAASPMGGAPAIGRCPANGAAPEIGAAPATLSSGPPEIAGPVVGEAISYSIPAAARPTVRPIAAERYEVRFTATAETREKLRFAQDLLGHAIPNGDLAQVFDRALTVLIDQLVRRKFAVTPHPRGSRGQANDSDDVPADVRRAVYVRDGGRCAFVSVDGHRCGERRFIEFHHVIPEAAGGKATVENIQLRCRAHNGHEVDLFFGPGMRRVRGDAGGVATRPGTSSRSRTDEFIPAAIRSGP
jgi:HNH endonuclease